MMREPEESGLTLPGANIAETMQRYRGRVQENPDDAEAWTKIGNILEHLEHDNAAVACFGRALEITPANPALLTARGKLLVEMDRLEEAVADYAAAYAAAPKDFLVRHGYALALRRAGRIEEALPHFQALLRQQPDDPDIKYEVSITCLHLGRFKEGWKYFDARMDCAWMKKRRIDAPQWKGEDLKGKTILIHKEQGFGDIILCTRYIPLVKARGARVLFECQSVLHRLFQTVPGIDKIANPEEIDEPFDYQTPIMSLPGIFGTDLQTIPPIIPLNIPASVPGDAARLLELGRDRFKVGIVWSGDNRFALNHKRAVHPSRFLPLTEIPGVQFYSLQKGGCEPELAECGGRSLILELGPLVNDFADTAAILRELDLVIMTDSSVVHLAGTLGCPVWDMVSHYAYWLYLDKREDSPWYPSVRFFRQPDPGNWDAVFEKVAEELKKAVALKKAGKWKNLVKAQPQNRKKKEKRS
jgi:tetratricopeptide (TPR) repeat protein